jgi:hypothetical protein
MSLYVCYNGLYLNEKDPPIGCHLFINRYNQIQPNDGALIQVRRTNAQVPDASFASQTTPSIAWTEDSPRGRLMVTSTNKDKVSLFRTEPRYLNILTAERAQEEAEMVVKSKLPSTLVFRPKKKVVKFTPIQPTGTGTTVVNLGATSILWKNGHANIACDHVGDNDVDILQNIPEWDTFTMTKGVIGIQSVQSECVPTLLDVPLGLGYTFAFITAPSPAGPNFQSAQGRCPR